MPRISVITPNLNQAQFVERAICSVLDQAYEDLEYIVIDGGSTDGSADIIRTYEGELTAWVSRPNAGRGDAINQGLERISGDLVCVLNSNDIYMPGALIEIAKLFNDDDAPDWVVGRCFRIGEQDEIIGTLDASAPDSLASFLMHNSGFLPVAASFLKRRCIDRLGAYEGHFRFANDYEYYCRLLANGIRPKITGKVFAARREGAGSRSAPNTLRSGLEHLEAASRYAAFLPRRQRYDLWSNLDRRRRIYALAEAEMDSVRARRALMGELIRHPWWLTDNAIRSILFHGVGHPLPSEMLRPAA